MNPSSGRFKFMIAAAGTGGHVFPGLAVAEVLKQQGHEVVWLGTEQGKVVQWVEQASVSLCTIAMRGVRGKGWRGWLTAPVQLWQAWRQAVQHLRQQRPDVLLVMGGYVSVPAGLAARWLGIPLVVHEQNSVAGLSNRLLAPFCQLLLLGLPLASLPIGWGQARWVGNPLRAMLTRQPKSHASQPLRLLIIGGSQGAQFLNERLPEVMQDWPGRREVSVWHQTGSQQQVQVEEAYRQAGVTARVSEFIQDMGEAYAWADVVIARAGALTVTELQQVARPALFIPFPHAVDDHQYTNSLALVKLGAAEVLRQSEASVEVLRERLSDYVYNPKSLSHCYAHLNAQLENTAAEQVAQVLIDLIMASPSHNKKEQQEV
jgi:UDP-N-acetylglucosamine--N-acetylmuramyl-(pentapeptide) pyrophosphoryl-undecaprenol N-acetylglucosamine transferase